MVYGYCSPLSLSCVRFMVKHTCSCSSLLPSQRNRTSSASSTIALHPRQGKSISVPISGTYLPFSSESKRKYKYSSVKVASTRPGETVVVTGNTWDDLVKNNEMPVLVEFWAPWCGPCRMVHREIEEIAKEYAGRISCFTLNADDDTEVAAKYYIKVVPVVLLFKNGEKQDSITGTMPYHVYVSAIEKLLSS